MNYPDDYINKIICGDCLTVMRDIPDKSIDLVLTDPPYGINYLSHRTDNHDKLKNDGFEEWKQCLPLWMAEFKRVLTDTGCCCCCCGGGKTPVTAIFTMEAIKHFNLIQTLVWKKHIGLGWNYRPAYENIVVLSKSKDGYNFYDETKSCSNVIMGFNQDIPQKGEHPTQKPVKLMQYLLNIHSKENDIVLEPFAGGGSTLEACKNSNRKFIGIEISQNYVDIANKRLAQEVFDFSIDKD